MFQRFELEKTIYVHPAFFGFWQENSLFLAKYILQGQLVDHVSHFLNGFRFNVIER